MWKTQTYQLKSAAPLIMHNGQTADPLNEYAKRLKQISSKRKKTDDDFEEMAHIEFLAGLYLSEEGPIIPMLNIEATLINAAKKCKEGPLAKAGMNCQKHAKLGYDGPRDPEDLWKDAQFRFSTIVRVQSSRIVRMRPIFPEWSAEVEIWYESNVINPARVNDWMKIAGSQVGFCDWRPRYGRFEVL